MGYSITKWVLWPIVWLFFRPKGIGSDSIPEGGAALLACNHVSYLDPLLLGIVTPKRVFFIAREDLFRHWLLGFVLRLSRTIPLDRNGFDHKAIRIAIRYLNQGRVLCLFPEGTRSSDGRVRGGQVGIGFLSVKTNTPVIPAYIHGTHKALPRGQRRIRPYPIRVIYGKPIHPAEISEEISDRERYRRITEGTMRTLKELETACVT
jgi:1-acyl-sn-glycerol-3-phosphate acyltransferase